MVLLPDLELMVGCPENITNQSIIKEYMTYGKIVKDVKLSVIVDLCRQIEIDGETTEILLSAIGMKEQMLRQLIMSARMSVVQELVEEKTLVELGMEYKK